jgi:hypothetical protein
VVSVSGIITSLAAALNAASVATLTSWSETELYQWADEAVKRLARAAGVFVTRTEIPIAALDNTIPLPAGHTGTIHVSLDGAILRPANESELSARDSDWENATGVVSRYTADTNGLDSLRVYKTPTADGTIALIAREHPADLAAASPNLAAPDPIGLYLRYLILAEARKREGDECMPDVAAHYQERLKLLDTVMQAYWGGGQ